MAAGKEFLRATLPALDLVHNLAQRSAADRADAEDMAQEGYLRAQIERRWPSRSASSPQQLQERVRVTVEANPVQPRRRAGDDPDRRPGQAFAAWHPAGGPTPAGTPPCA